MSPGRVRVLRGTAAAGASTALALAFHVAGGAPVPGVLGILTPLVLTALLAVPLMSPRPRLLPTLAVTTLAQVAFHALFVLGTPAAAGSATHGHHAHGVHPDLALALDPATAVSLQGDARMWSMHGVAALVTALLVQRGELLVRTMLRLAHALAASLTPALPRALPVVSRSAAAPPSDDAAHPLLTRVTTTTRRRGPPLVLAA